MPKRRPSKRKIRKQAELEAVRAMNSAKNSLEKLTKKELGLGRDIPLPPTSDKYFK